jgi:hypothetical protein
MEMSTMQANTSVSHTGCIFPCRKQRLLASESPFLRACVGGSFKEAQESRLVFDDRDPRVVALLLHHLYVDVCDLDDAQEIEINGAGDRVYTTTFVFEDDLDLGDSAEDFNVIALISLIRLYLMADEWLMPKLRQQAETAIMHWDDNLGYPTMFCGPDKFPAPNSEAVKVYCLFIKVRIAMHYIPKGDELRFKVIMQGIWFSEECDTREEEFISLMREHEPEAVQMSLLWKKV